MTLFNVDVYLVTGLAEGNTYYFQVMAHNDAGYGPASPPTAAAFYGKYEYTSHNHK